MSGLNENPRVELNQPTATNAQRSVEPGSAEHYLSECRQELEYNSKIVEELREKLRSVCQPETEEKTRPADTATSPRSSLSDAFAQMSIQLARNNDALRDLARRLDLP